MEEGGKAEEVDGDMGEGMDDADDGVAGVEEEDKATGEVDDLVALELLQVHREEFAAGGVEEGDGGQCPRRARPTRVGGSGSRPT